MGDRADWYPESWSEKVAAQLHLRDHVEQTGSLWKLVVIPEWERRPENDAKIFFHVNP